MITLSAMKKSLNEIRQYIKNNPLKWQFDTENPIVNEKNKKNQL